MKKLYPITILAILLFSLIVFAQDEIATQDDITIAGILPDQAFYGLKIGWQRFTDAFSEKARIKHAQQRLAEAKVMLSKNKPELAKKAIDEFNYVRERIKEKPRIEEHTKVTDSLGRMISDIASVKGQLNETQKEEIKALILAHKEKISAERGKNA